MVPLWGVLLYSLTTKKQLEMVKEKLEALETELASNVEHCLK